MTPDMNEVTQTLTTEALSAVGEAASAIAELGQHVNNHLLRQYRKDWRGGRLKEVAKKRDIPLAHVEFYRAVAQSLGWLQGNETRDAVLNLAFEILCASRIGDKADALGRLNAPDRGIPKLRRPDGVQKGLSIWIQAQLPQPDRNGKLDMAEVQDCALRANDGKIQWLIAAPLKMYAMAEKLDAPRSPIYFPLGSAVTRGIKKLFGLTLGESRSDYEIGRELHIRLAELGNVSTWDINSGLYAAGGGSWEFEERA